MRITHLPCSLSFATFLLSAAWCSLTSGTMLAHHSPPLEPLVQLHNNAVFVGIANPLSLEVTGVHKEQLRVSVSDGDQIKCTAPGEYLLFTDGTKPAELITEHIQSHGTPVELDRRHLQSQRIPDPQARFGGQSTQDTCIRLVVAQHAPCVSAGLHHSDWDIPLEVHSFSMFLDQGDELIQMHSHSARLTADQKNLLDSAEVGDLLSIEDIVVVLPDGSLRALASLKFRLTT